MGISLLLITVTSFFSLCIDLADLEVQLQAAKGSRTAMIVTDGVFSMDGEISQLPYFRSFIFLLLIQ